MSSKVGEALATAFVVGLCLAVMLWATSYAPGPMEEAHAYRNGAQVGAYIALAALAALLIIPTRKGDR
jgi:hypothetical protein